jgi:hypothetical protein
MECTAAACDAANVLDLSGLWRHLGQLPDRRHRKGRRYELGAVLILIVLAKLCGQDHPSGIADWIGRRSQPLRAALHLRWARMPHHNTYRRILEQVVSPETLDEVVSRYLCSLPGVGHSVLIAIDGKTVRGTIDAANPRGDHLLAAYLPEEGVVLLQVAAGAKENEISVAPRLLQELDLRDKVIAGDAMHTQRALSRQIVAAGGDYLWLVKDNQPTLRDDIAQLFTADAGTVLGGQVRCPTTSAGAARWIVATVAGKFARSGRAAN